MSRSPSLDVMEINAEAVIEACWSLTANGIFTGGILKVRFCAGAGEANDAAIEKAIAAARAHVDSRRRADWWPSDHEFRKDWQIVVNRQPDINCSINKKRLKVALLHGPTSPPRLSCYSF